MRSSRGSFVIRIGACLYQQRSRTPPKTSVVWQSSKIGADPSDELRWERLCTARPVCRLVGGGTGPGVAKRGFADMPRFFKVKKKLTSMATDTAAVLQTAKGYPSKVVR